jgi:hypothetical protein
MPNYMRTLALSLLIIPSLLSAQVIVAQNILVPGVAVTIPSMGKGGTMIYSFTVPTGATNLTIKTTGSTGDADIYLNKDKVASSLKLSKWKSIKSKSLESITVTSPTAGTYYLTVHAYSATTNTVVTMNYTGGIVSTPVPATPVLTVPNTVMCAADTYACSNGVVVGRTGVNCTFTCPVVPVATTTVVVPIATIPALVAENSSAFSYGNRVSVIALSNIRDVAGTTLGTQGIGVSGSIISGPITSGAITRWNVNFDSGVDGWISEANLTLASTQIESISTLASTITTWSRCASEVVGTPEVCAVSGTREVRYGIPGAYTTKVVTGSTECNDVAFKAPNTPYQNFCEVSSKETLPPIAPPVVPTPSPTVSTPLPNTWTKCADEYGTCTFSGKRRVVYGVSPTAQNTIRVAENSILCDNTTFTDPAPTFGKSCWYEKVTTTAQVTASVVVSTPTPTPVVTPQPVTQVTTAVGPRVSSFANSGPIVATAGQVISGVRITNPSGACITINVPNVTVRDSDIGPCGGEANINVTSNGGGSVIEYNTIRAGGRGLMARSTNNVVTRYNSFTGEYFGGSGPINCWQEDGRNNGCSSAIEYDFMQSGTIEGNKVRGNEYGTDAINLYQTSGTKIINNDVNVGLYWQHASPFMIGDSFVGGDPGHDNYIAGNITRGVGGVPSGVLGSSGNTIIEKNCFASGVQIYRYNNNPLNGMTVRNNVINLNQSAVPDTSILSSWSTNINSTDCGLLPK